MTDLVTSHLEKVDCLVEQLKTMPPAECPVTHRFAKGCYIREMCIPKNTVLVGKIHKEEHFNNLMQGRLVVVTLEGRFVLKAPFTFVSPAGTQKVIFTLEDSILQNVHITDKTDVDEIEKDLICESYDQGLIDRLVAQLEAA